MTFRRFVRRLTVRALAFLPAAHGDLDGAGRDRSWARGFVDGRLAEHAGAGPLPEDNEEAR